MVLLDALLPAPAVAEHGHETCRLVPIHPVLTSEQTKQKEKSKHQVQDFTQ
jgi:folate-dependent tRNA-U54 methylase TrmFO/GidA